MRECWQKQFGRLTRHGCKLYIGEKLFFDPSAVDLEQYTIPELLEQADIVRMAAYDYVFGKFVTPGLSGIYIYPKPHTYHKLQPPKGDI